MVKVTEFAQSNGELVEATKFHEIVGLVWFPEGISLAERDAKTVKAIDLFVSSKPAEGVEAMLAAQMVGTHYAAMECLRRSLLYGQTSRCADSSATAYGPLRSTDGGSRQAPPQGPAEITVERVQVAACGQVIVGDIHTTKSAVPPQVQQQESLETPREDTVPLEAPLPRTKAAS